MRRFIPGSVLSACAAATFMLCASAQAAPDVPNLKPGLWEMTSSTSRAPDTKSKSTLCLDASVQQELIKMSTGMMSGMCSKNDLKRTGNTFVGEAVCNLGGSTMRSKSVMTLNGDTSYRTEAQASFDPPMNGMSQSSTVIEGKHIGACKPGQKPGDLSLPSGQTVNIRNAMSAKK